MPFALRINAFGADHSAGAYSLFKTSNILSITLKKSLSFILIALVASLVTLVSYASSPGLAERSKARYYFLEGARLKAMNRLPEAYEYFKKAYLTDSTYVDAASEYGLTRLLLPVDSMRTKPQVAKSLAMIRSYVDTYPADVYGVRYYAYFSQQLDTVAEAIRVYERLDSLSPTATYELLSLADLYADAGRPDDALSTLVRFETAEGKSPQLSMKKMGIMLVKKDTVAALREADELIATNPREPYFHILKGNLYEVIGDNDSVLASYKRAEAVNPDNGPAKLSLATYYKNMGDSVSYDRKVYEALLSEDFEIDDKLSLLGEYLQTLLDDQSDTSRGDHLFDVLMEQYPHDPSVLDLAARYSGAKSDYEDAIAQIGYAIDLDPSNPVYWQQLMSYQIAADKGDEAMATFDRASEHIAVTDQLRLMYGSAASMAKRYDEAERIFGDLIHYYSEELPLNETITDDTPLKSMNYETLMRLSSIYSVLGDTYYNAGRLDDAYGAYDNSLLFNPENPLTLNNYAYFLSENNGDLEKAENMARKAIELAPDNETYLDTMAWVLFKKKDYKEALEFQEKAINIAEEKGDVAAEFYNHLGDIMFMNHEPEKALQNWKKALELEPDNALLKKKVTHKTFFFE